MGKKIVSIFCITYNHEKYIAQALDGFLMQKTTFDFEIVVGEDCSTDNTRQILLAYREKHPDKIKLLLNEKNLGMMLNGIQTLEACTGKYIASCEGDDYWNDPLKLQKQVDFLEANPDFAFCFHKTKVIFEDGSQEPFISNDYTKEVLTFEDLVTPIDVRTVSVVSRNGLIGKFPDWLLHCPVGDYPMNLLTAQYGKAKCMDDVMAVYRINEGGAWGAIDEVLRTLKWLRVLEMCKEHFYPRGAKEFDDHIERITKKDLLYYFGKTFSEQRYENYQSHYGSVSSLFSAYDKKMLPFRIRYLLTYFPFAIPVYLYIAQTIKNTKNSGTES